MKIFSELKKVNHGKSFFVNPSQIVMISHGDAHGTTKIELPGQRTFDVEGTIESTIAKLEKDALA